MRRGRKPHIAWQAGPLHAAAWPVFESHLWTAQTHRSLFQAAGPSSAGSTFQPQPSEAQSAVLCSCFQLSQIFLQSCHCQTRCPQAPAEQPPPAVVKPAVLVAGGPHAGCLPHGQTPSHRPSQWRLAADRCCQQRSPRHDSCLQELAPHCCCPQQPRWRQLTPRAEHSGLAAPDSLAAPSPSAAAMLQRSAVHKRPPAALPGAGHAPRGLRQRLWAHTAAHVLRRQ